MKKVLLALLALVLVVAVGLWAFWPQVRLLHMRLILDRVLIPALQAQYQAATGFQPTVTYQDLRAEGTGYEVDGLAMSTTGEAAVSLTAKSLILDKVDMGLWADRGGCDLALRETVVEYQGFKLSASNTEVSGLRMADGGRSFSLARKFVQDIRLEGKGLPRPLEIASVEALDYQLRLDPERRASQGTLGQVTVVGQDIQARLGKAVFDGDLPRLEKGQPVYDKVNLRTGKLEVSANGRPILDMDEMTMETSRGVDKAADRVELRGLSGEIPPGKPAAQTLAELGYERARLDVVYDYAYDRAAKTFTLKELTLSAPQAGKLGLSLSMEDLDYDLSKDFQANLPAVRKSRPSRIGLRYDDESLVGRLLALGARREGVGLEEYRARLIKSAPPLPNQDNFQDTIAAFLAKPGSLCLSITPQKKLTLEDFGKVGPQMLPLLLQVKLDDCSK